MLQAITKGIFRFEKDIYVKWTTTVDEKSQYNLSQPLISRNPETKLIQVNFNPQVKSLNEIR